MANACAGPAAYRPRRALDSPSCTGWPRPFTRPSSRRTDERFASRGSGPNARRSVEDAPALVTFLKRVFAATGEFRPEAPSLVTIGDSLVMVSGAGSREVFPAFLHVYVEDADSTCRRALDAGAVSLEAVRDTPYGDRAEW